MIDLELLRTSITNLVSQFVEFVPRFIGGALILLLGWLIARALAAIVRRIGRQVKLDRILDTIGIKERLQQAGIERTASDLIAVFIFWLVFLNFLLIGLESMGLTAAVEPLRNVIGYLPQLLGAIIVLVAGILVAQFIGRAVEAAAGSTGIEFGGQIGRAVTGLIIIMVIVVVMGQLGMDASILVNIVTIVIAVSLGGLALAFGLGGRPVARNVLAGYYARERFSPGDRVMIEGQVGTLEGIGTLNTEIELGGETLIVPNTHLTESVVRVVK